VIDLSPEKEQIRIMMNNMSRQYHDYLDFQAMTTYDSLIEAATGKKNHWLIKFSIEP